MAAPIGALRAELSASIAKFQQDMDKASQAVKALGDAAAAQRRKIEGTNTAFGALGSTIRRYITAGVVLGFARSIFRMASDLQDAADQLNLTTQELQGLRAVALKTGASTDIINRALGVLTTNIADAEKGMGPLAEAMRKYGVNLGKPMEVLLDFADRVKNADTITEKMAISTALFGDRLGRQLVPALNQGADGIRRMFDEAQKEGQIWDPAVIAKIDEAGDKFEELKVGIQGVFAELFVWLQKVTSSREWAEFWTRIGGLLMLRPDIAFGGAPREGPPLRFLPNGQLSNLGGEFGQGGLAGHIGTGDARTPPPPSPAMRSSAESAEQKRLAFLAHLQEEAAKDFEEAVKGLREAYVGQAQSVQNQLATAQQIGDLMRRMGAGPFGETADRLRDIQKELDSTRVAALVKIRELENDITEATLEGKTDLLEGLNQELALQQQLHDLVVSTSAEQIQAAERINAAFKDFSSSLSSELSDMLLEWKVDVDGLRNVFKKLIQDLFIKPATDSVTNALSSFLKGIVEQGSSAVSSGEGMFQGGFASGGFIEPGKWGFAGENGVEPVFGGKAGATVFPNESMVGRAKGDTYYIDAKGADATGIRRLERTLAEMSRNKRKEFRVLYADLAGATPR